MVSTDGNAAVCSRIHRILDPLKVYSDPDDVPFNNGLYFFYEKGEQSSHDDLPGIVRVGNHPRSPDRLCGRLWDHYSPNKNLSVFRKFLGGALLRRENPEHPCLKPAPGKGHWEIQKGLVCPKCRPLEDRVTRLLRENFVFRCVEIREMEQRNGLEKKLIGSLSLCPSCAPSVRWLGKYAYSDKVKDYGLWNSNHAGGPDVMSLQDLMYLERLVGKT
ncbi:MAG: hypothetical protein Q8P12_07095 [bacterium]|nr:hypothetical protein [bacterium]